MEEKYILVSLEDEKAKKIAEILGNKTCKKIVNFLAETKEASEQDIAKELELPLNTIEYNLKKLVDAGLVEKAKNFFWSVKGRKINMYKLVKKHIVISPKISKPTSTMLKTILPVIIGIALIFLIVALLPKGDIVVQQTNELKQFSSQAELQNFVKENIESSRGGFLAQESALGGVTTTGTTGAAKADSAQDFSQTNIQVEGVDEADIVKNDDKYIYAVSGKKIIIVDAYPAEDMKILSEIEFNNSISEIFINNDKLIVFIPSGYGYGGESAVFIYDISDRENPELDKEVELDGYYSDSRMIGNYVYVISNKYIYTENPEPPIFVVGGVEKAVQAKDVYYFDYPDYSYSFTSIIALNIENSEFESKTYLIGSSGTIYVSQDNIYLTYTKYLEYKTRFEQQVEEVYIPLLPAVEKAKVIKIMDSDKNIWEKSSEVEQAIYDYSNSLKGDEKAEFDSELLNKLQDFEFKLQKKYEKTVVHKINIDKENIKYIGSGEVPGQVLNQFSMDEYEGNFRIATTTGQVSRTGEASSLNHLYVLDKDLAIVGSVEDLAPGERIYSARFIGKRAYIVTFKKVDPLFVIDVSNPKNPEVLGYLKITGYSDYLHPYDENHIIGIGKETRGGDEHFSWYQGIKISLFDVSDVENPIEQAKIEIGDRGTDSEALYEHKAFLFDKKNNLLVIPVMLAEINESQYTEQEGSVPDNAYGTVVWQGAYVLNINEDEISLRGKITHDDNQSLENRRWYYYGGKYSIRRSLYMDNYLYTISAGKIKANDLQTVNEIKSVDLGYEEENYYDVYY